MTPRQSGEDDEARKARQRREVAAYEEANALVPGTGSHAGDGPSGGPTGGVPWNGRARMAAARLGARGPSALDDRDREALRRHPEHVPADHRPPVDRPVAQVGSHHPATSRAAASRARPRSGSDRLRVLAFIEAAGERGATDDELEVALSLPHQTASARRNGLVADGWLVASGHTRPTRTGSDATVWVIAP